MDVAAMDVAAMDVAGRDELNSQKGAGPDWPDLVVSVGTDHHRFNRIVRWIDDYVRARTATDADLKLDVIVQRGTSTTPRRVRSEELIPHDQLCEMFANAKVVVCHGGPSTVMDARRSGRLPIVVPRDPAFEEHIDGHQLRFAKHLTTHEMAIVVTDQGSFFQALDAALAAPETVTIPASSGRTPDGVVRFASVVDDLLGITTKLRS